MLPLKNPLLRLIAVSGIFLVLQTGCKKTLTINDDTAANDTAATAKFLKAPANTDPVVSRIITTIRQQEQQYHFLNKIIAKEGYAMWQNARIMTMGSLPSLPPSGEAADTIVLIPLVLANTSYVNSFISCRVNNKVAIKLYRGRDYANYSFTKNTDSINAQKIALTCMDLEYETFQHNKFTIKDKKLLNYRPDGKEPSKTTLTIRPASSALPTWVTIFYTYEIEVENENPFDVPCPVGQACQWTHTETVYDSYNVWVADFGNWSGADFPNDPWATTGGQGGGINAPCGGICNPVIDSWEVVQDPLTDANGFYYSRIGELQQKLAADPFALEPCDSLNIMPLNPETGYGNMWQRVAQFTPTPYIQNRIDSIRNVNPAWLFDNFNYTNLSDAYGGVVNCDYFPVKITQLPNGFTAQSLTEYFRKNINSFVDNSLGIYFEAYQQNYTYNGVTSLFIDTAKFNANQENSLGALIHIHMLDDGSVVESDYFHSNVNGIQKHRFKFTTMSTPLDDDHPVAGNREFGIFNTQASPNEYTFYTMGVDRFSDWKFALVDALTGSQGFKKADQLWSSVQSNMILFINSHGGQAAYYSLGRVIARSLWNEVEKYLKNQEDWATLKQKLGC